MLDAERREDTSNQNARATHPASEASLISHVSVQSVDANLGFRSIKQLMDDNKEHEENEAAWRTDKPWWKPRSENDANKYTKRPGDGS